MPFTDTPPSPPAADALASRRMNRLALGVTVVLIALKAFALGASGSVSLLASLTDSGLDLIASLTTLYAVRWAAGAPLRDRGDAMAALVQAGLVFASAAFVGWEALQRIADPRPVGGGAWAVGVVVISLLLTGALVWLQTRTLRNRTSPIVSADRTRSVADLASGVVVLIGVVSGTWLAAPGLDAAAGLIIVVWLVWGALATLKPAAERLTTA